MKATRFFDLKKFKLILSRTFSNFLELAALDEMSGPCWLRPSSFYLTVCSMQIIFGTKNFDKRMMLDETVNFLLLTRRDSLGTWFYNLTFKPFPFLNFKFLFLKMLVMERNCLKWNKRLFQKMFGN